MNLFIAAFITYFSIGLNAQAHVSPEKTLDPKSEQIYSKFCKGGIDQISGDLQKVEPSEDTYIASQLWYLSSNTGVNEALSRFDQSVDIKMLPEIDRLIFANALLESHSNNFAIIHKLIDFVSSNKILESYRKSTEAHLDRLEGKPQESLRKLTEAFDEMPYLDSSLLVGIFDEAMVDKETAGHILMPYFKYIDHLSDSNAQKFTLLHFKEFVESNWKNPDKAYSYLKQAYNLCKYDRGIALLYVYSLRHNGQNEEAKNILLGQIEQHKFYSPIIDLTLAQIYLLENDSKNADKFLGRAEDKKAYLSERNRRRLDELDAKGRDKSIGIIAAIFILALILGGGILISKRYSSKKS